MPDPDIPPPPAGAEPIDAVMARLRGRGELTIRGLWDEGERHPLAVALRAAGGVYVEVESPTSEEGAWRALDAECRRRGLYGPPGEAGRPALSPKADMGGLPSLFTASLPSSFGPDWMSGFLWIAASREWAAITEGCSQDEVVELVPASRVAEAVAAKRERIARAIEAKASIVEARAEQMRAEGRFARGDELAEAATHYRMAAVIAREVPDGK